MVYTKRLFIKPLNYQQLIIYSTKKDALEEVLGLNKTPGYLSPALKEAIETTMLPALADPEKNYLYATLWVVISKQDNIIVGGISFTGSPDVNGEIEIGYGCYEESRNKGYMKEAVKGMLIWAATQSEVLQVKTCISVDNIASNKILSQNNFIKVDEIEEIFNWIYKIKNKMFKRKRQNTRQQFTS